MQSNQDFAFICAVAVAVVTVLAVRANSRAERLAAFGLLVASLAALFGSLVRSGLVGGAIGSVAAAALLSTSSTSRRRVLLGGLSLTAVIYIFAVVGPSLLPSGQAASTLESRVESIFSPGSDYSVNARTSQTWPAAIKIIEGNLLGGGPGSAGSLSEAQPLAAPFGAVVPDNGYLLVTVQLGLVGLALFVLVLYLVGRSTLSRAKAGSAWAAAGFGALLALVVGMLASSFWGLTSPASLWAIVIGLALNREVNARKAMDHPRMLGPTHAEARA